MNPKRILSLSLAALAASCVESTDKPVLRGQATTKKIQRQRQLKKESEPVEACGGFGGTCCQTKIKGTVYSYCNSGSHTCSVDTNKCDDWSQTQASSPYCVPADQDSCDVLASGNFTFCDIPGNATSCGYDSKDEGTCSYPCQVTCHDDPNITPQNNQFVCNGMCHPHDSYCCIESSDPEVTWCY